MFAIRTPSARPTGSIRALLISALVAAAAATGSIAPTSASAYTITSSGQYPGAVTGYQVEGSHWNTCPGNPTACWSAWVNGPGPRVYRSPASTATQKITVVYQLLRWNGSAWIQQATRAHVRNLGAGYGSIQMPGIDFLPSVAGYFRVNIAVAWENQDGSRSYGQRVLSYNQTGDYVCDTLKPCATGEGWVWLRY